MALVWRIITYVLRLRKYLYLLIVINNIFLKFNRNFSSSSRGRCGLFTIVVSNFHDIQAINKKKILPSFDLVF